ncbi:MAG: glycosyltransferase family 9 protein [Candidatus Omnitrophica bacterium]|nr:glycosyltransferase family 9 protein [Candidatus Omnitrophota bacterium]
MKTFKNILVVRTDRMGDVVLTVPAVRALKKKFPDAKVTVWLDASTKPLMQGLPFIDEVIVEDKGLGLFGFLSFVAMLRRRKYDLAIIYHTKRHTNAACMLAGIPIRLGYKNNKNGYMLTRPVEDRRHLGEKHEVQYCLDLLAPLGVGAGDVALELPRDVQAEQWADEFIRVTLEGKPFLVIHPDASCATRCWPAKSYVQLISYLTSSGMKIVLVGGRGASLCAGEIVATSCVPLIDLTAKTSLAQMIALFRRASAVISNDSGPVHVAAGVGVPIVSIFLRRQPGINPERWKPLGPKSRVVLPPPGREIVVDAHSRVIRGSFDAITPEQVFKALQEIL